MKILRNIIITILVVVILFVGIYYIVDIIRFPECYISTWRYQLWLDLERGDLDAIAYYYDVYIANDRPLF